MSLEAFAFLASADEINQDLSYCLCAWPYVVFHTEYRFNRKESQRLIMQHFVNGKIFINPEWGEKKTEKTQQLANA